MIGVGNNAEQARDAVEHVYQTRPPCLAGRPIEINLDTTTTPTAIIHLEGEPARLPKQAL